ncbi:isocitrate lyase/PEP mutase family protein [Glacieibacterium frigidum]|uniref:Isocitrate lyase/phosphoenolpyruvate mutase family protein n=1 Tax=Glacieibacterium frigidum TaxID=2593303 RepID=A0A552U920_9SPHN|nr:isocitrate lyase/phosphoenolpyruvate mutase family protein [Glacieibacterium frigidum]TRW14712.1 isocitrate lyase/phosphoenolpyruvate mutase family protein [Glacieibacterium frigidum]
MSVAEFRALHDGPAPLILVNAWDAGSAKLMASLGAKAIATTSAAVAWAHGWPDGDTMPWELLLTSLRAIVGAVDVPVSADVEGGFSDDPAAVADLVAAVVDTGAVGINIEDGSSPPDLLCAKIASIRSRCGDALFVNARTDVYLRGLAAPDARLTETQRRAKLYTAAGADGLFVPGVTDEYDIATLAAGTALPLNVLARPGLPGALALSALGVRRLSAGSGVAEAAWAAVRAKATAFLSDGDSDALCEGGGNYSTINALMTARA